MKKLKLTFCLLLATNFLIAQFTATGNYKTYQKITNSRRDTVNIFMYNGITATDTIKYTGTASTANWFKYSETITNTSNYFPELTNIKDSTGYVFVANGKKTYIWVIDYQKHLPVFSTFDYNLSQDKPCESVKFNYSTNIPLNYCTPDNISHILDREFTVKYKTLSWSNDKWTEIDTTQTIILPTSELLIPTPLCNTEFIISGDQYAADLGLQPYTKTSSSYTTVAVKCHITTLIASRERDKNNEADAPMQKKEINFSGPIDIQFLSNANEPSTLYYNWDIFKNKQLLINRRDKEHRYTFTEAGVYTVKLKASNQKCDDTDSITVTVTESALFVPNVFTPNGDGMNDEFRVAYKSLVSFEAWVFNRWGRRVFYWNDPQKGWDGNINGKKASPGPYFYVIKASGYGLDPKNPDPAVLSTVTKKGDINLLRGKGN